MAIELESHHPQFKRIKGHLTQWGDAKVLGVTYAAGICCPDCNWQAYQNGVSFKSWANAIVGFTNSVHYKSSSDYLGTLIFECPKCFKRFWIHLRGQWLVEYLENCEKWPQKDLRFVASVLNPD